MYQLLVILLSLYPATFLYNAIPSAYMKSLNTLAPSGILYFVSHLIVFTIIFFFIFSVLKKFITLGFMNAGKKRFVGIAVLILLVLAVATIIFYQVLPGSTVYASPKFVDDYILTQPFTLIILLLPFAYLFFE